MNELGSGSKFEGAPRSRLGSALDYIHKHRTPAAIAFLITVLSGGITIKDELFPAKSDVRPDVAAIVRPEEEKTRKDLHQLGDDIFRRFDKLDGQQSAAAPLTPERPTLPSPAPVAAPPAGLPSSVRTRGEDQAAEWEAVPLNTAAAKDIPLFVRRDFYTEDANFAANLIVDELSAAGFHLVDNEDDAALLIRIKNTTQTAQLTQSQVRADQFRPWQWDTTIHIVVQFVHGKVVIDQDITATALGGREAGRTESMDQAVSNICKAIFGQCRSK